MKKVGEKMEGHNMPFSAQILGSNQGRTGVDRGWVSTPVSQSLLIGDGFPCELSKSAHGEGTVAGGWELSCISILELRS